MQRPIVFLAVPMMLLAAGCGGGSSGVTDAAKVVGRWTRDVTQADWNRHGIGDKGLPTGVWTMTIKEGGVVSVYSPGRPAYPDFTTRFSDTPGGHFVVGRAFICDGGGKYRWNRSGTRLDINVTADKDCQTRAALFSGAWTKK